MIKADLFLTQENSLGSDSINTHIFSTEQIDKLHSNDTLQFIAEQSVAPFIFFQVKTGELNFDKDSLQKILDTFQQNNADLGYTPFIEIKKELRLHPVNEYQIGSIRDDFDFGPLVIFKRSTIIEYLRTVADLKHSSWYDFRLFCTRKSMPKLIEIAFYTYQESDLRLSGQKQFDYVDPANQIRQIELEKVAGKHLEAIGAKVSPPFKKVDFDTQQFNKEVSVIIPVLNREKTIRDAIQSVLKQQTNFDFNILVINNHSTDGTSTIIEEINDDRVIQITPEETNLGIGGCWNKGINDDRCGKFAVQLDSDDLYLDENTLQKIVNQFYAKHCAMVIGSYQMVNFKLEEIPPGIIDHKEWTDANGANNALRINGLGAPRAFFTPIIRKIQFPNVSYGEDYAVAIQISREYQIGRIYDPIYLCRRWDDNTDANLNIEKSNAHNAYKDSLRSAEILRRIDLYKD